MFSLLTSLSLNILIRTTNIVFTYAEVLEFRFVFVFLKML